MFGTGITILLVRKDSAEHLKNLLPPQLCCWCWFVMFCFSFMHSVVKLFIVMHSTFHAFLVKQEESPNYEHNVLGKFSNNTTICYVIVYIEEQETYL